jgi:hypothetical protein
MNRLLLLGTLSLLLVGLAGGWVPASRAAAQIETGTICVSAFADANANGAREAGEGPLAGVNVNLATGGVIIATHLTAENEPEYCFENLLRGIYTVSFTDSPLYRITTAREGTFALDAGQRLTLDPFGAFPVGAEGLRAEVVAQAAAAGEDEPLDTPARLLLATVGATMVMLFMIGLGAVVLGLRDWRSQRRRAARVPPPPPDLLRPPGVW